jgi:sugar transferase EpsL
MTHSVKKLVDSLGAVLGLVISSPIMIVIAIVIRLSMGSPVLFRQRRPGHREKPFSVLKFRTMREELGSDGNPLPDEERLTRAGSFIRKTSLDELPQFFNVLKGEMSFVGPRPLLMQYLDRYTPEQRRRHEAKPGITGWAQVNGRNVISWEEKFALDVWYVDNRSLWLDFKILLMTVVKVLRREGISQEGQATAEEFMGTETIPNSSSSKGS